MECVDSQNLHSWKVPRTSKDRESRNFVDSAASDAADSYPRKLSYSVWWFERHLISLDRDRKIRRCWSSHRASCVCKNTRYNSQKFKDRDFSGHLCRTYSGTNHLHKWKTLWKNYSCFRQIFIENPYLAFVGGVFHQSGQHNQNQGLRGKVGQDFRIE